MNREDLLILRKAVFDEYKTRTRLGDFDANSSSIRTCLHALVEIVNHQLEELKKESNVHSETKHRAKKVSTRRPANVAK